MGSRPATGTRNYSCWHHSRGIRPRRRVQPRRAGERRRRGHVGFGAAAVPRHSHSVTAPRSHSRFAGTNLPPLPSLPSGGMVQYVLGDQPPLGQQARGPDERGLTCATEPTPGTTERLEEIDEHSGTEACEQRNRFQCNSPPGEYEHPCRVERIDRPGGLAASVGEWERQHHDHDPDGQGARFRG
jgi:hypothetical protein